MDSHAEPYPWQVIALRDEEVNSIGERVGGGLKVLREGGQSLDEGFGVLHCRGRSRAGHEDCRIRVYVLGEGGSSMIVMDERRRRRLGVHVCMAIGFLL